MTIGDRRSPIEDEECAAIALFGIAGDPATGSASGPLGCYLASHKLLPVDRLSHFISLQGMAMKRPCRLHVSIGLEQEAITSVRVGGRSVLVRRRRFGV